MAKIALAAQHDSTGPGAMRARVLAAVLALGLVLAAPPSATSRQLEPLVLGWERFFTIQWESWEQRGRPLVGGYIRNEAGFTATRVQLLVEALDPGRQVLDQQVHWLGTALTPGMRAYFEIPAPARSAAYRVRVFAYDWLQAAWIQQP
jgi:hypothetical protein